MPTPGYAPAESITATRFEASRFGCTRVVHTEQRLSIRASEAEKALLRRAAQARHVNTSQFVLQASLDAAQALLAERAQFRLPPAQWEAFRQRLDAPARTIPELDRLFGEPEPYDL